MDLSSGYPFWLVRDGLPFDYQKLDSDIITDVVVLGGGISGALVAWQLIRAGIETVVVDRRSIGLGSTCASTALLQYEIDTALHELQGMIGRKKAVRSYKLCEEAIFDLQKIARQIDFTEFELKQSLYYAAAKKDLGFLQSEYNARLSAGFDVQWLDETIIKKEYGFPAPAAILSESGAQIDAYGFTHGLLQASAKKGLQVFDRTEVAGIEHSEKGVRMLTTQGYELKSRYLVYTTGYEVVQYIDKKIVDLHSTYAIISEQANEDAVFWKDDVLIWNTADPYLYLRNTSDRRIIIGGRDEDFSSPLKRDKLLNRKKSLLTNDFKKIFPQIPFTAEFSWAGTFGSTKDGLPFIGTYKKLPNSFFALGFGGNGITFSQVAAKLIRDLIKGKASKDAELFSFDRV